MNFDQHEKDMRTLRKEGRIKSIAIALQSLALLVALGVILSLLGTERTILVPPDINKTFWVAKDKTSREYLEQMGAFVAWLQLDVTPSSIDWKRDVLLGYVPPEDYAAAKTQMDLEAERLRRNNAATFFQVQQLVANEQDQSVRLIGRMRSQINGMDVAEPDVRSFKTQFKYAGGRVQISLFKEVRNAQPGQTPVGAAGTNAGAR
jgi:conjugal transfer pilus assembly protein TraE